MGKNFLRNHLKSEFAQIPNSLIEDRTISATARALFCYLAVKPDNWEFFMPDIAAGLLISQDTLRKVIKELVSAGWISDDGQDRKNGQFGSKIISIFAFKTPKTGGNGVGNFPNRQKNESAKNRIGKNPTHNNIKSQKILKFKKYSSSSEEEEEGVVAEFVPSLVETGDPETVLTLPPQLSHLMESVVFDWIKSKSEHHDVRNPARYRTVLRAKVETGDPETVENILIFAESSSHKPTDRAARREIGEIVQQIGVTVQLLRREGCSKDDIDYQVERILRKAIGEGKIEQKDVKKIENDLSIYLGGIA